MKLEIPQELTGLLHSHYDTVLADDSLSDVDVLLFSLYLIERQQNSASTARDKLKDAFVSLGRKDDNFRKAFFSAKQSSSISEVGDSISFLSKGLDRINKISGQLGKSPVYIIKSSETFTAIKRLEEFLSGQSNTKEVWLCDSYISESTLFPFTAMRGKTSLLKVLTTNISDQDKFNGYKAKFEKEIGISVQVKISKMIHDRFIIFDGSCWSIGCSIKDIGNKDTMIREISEVSGSMKSLFSERWSESKSI